MNTHHQLTIHSSLKEILQTYPGARRFLFRRYHLGGCSSCSFSLEESLLSLSQKTEGMNANEVLEELAQAHLEDQAMLITPQELFAALNEEREELLILDLRTKEEFDAVQLPGSRLLTQELIGELMQGGNFEKKLVFIDHYGERSLDAAAYFVGHGFQFVKALKGGIDGYALEVKGSLPRYTLEQE